MTNLTETPDVSRIEALVTQGMHRIGDHEGPFSLRVLGLGKTGANVIESMVTAHRSGGVAADTETPFHALAIDIGGDELTPIQEAAAAEPGTSAPIASLCRTYYILDLQDEVEDYLFDLLLCISL